MTGPLLCVQELRLDGDGAVGIPGEVVDVHNRRHEASRNRGANPVSVGFMTNYAAMRERFGGHMVDGVAGENILVEGDATELADELTVGEARLGGLVAAEPCEPFARWALRSRDGDIAEALRFLRHGRRGWYGTPIVAATVRLGDAVYLAES